MLLVSTGVVPLSNYEETVMSDPIVLIHVLISLVGIATGFVVIFGMLLNQRMNFMTALFLHTTTLTSITGFFIQADHVMPSHIVGVISLVVLAAAYVARYRYNLVRSWRWIFIVCAIVAQFLNVFVGIVQSFQKIPALHALAPTQSEPPFVIAQGSALLLFLVCGFLAIRKFAIESDSELPKAFVTRNL